MKKKCTGCNVKKSTVEFYKNGTRLRPQCKACVDLRQAAARFGLLTEDLLSLYEQQGGRCAICKKECDVYRNLSIDHDHKCCKTEGRSCGKCVRGLLCAKCNHGIGSLKEDIRVLESAIEYLKKYEGH